MNIIVGEVNVISIITLVLALVVQSVLGMSYLNKIANMATDAKRVGDDAMLRVNSLEGRFGELAEVKFDVGEARKCCASCRESMQMLNSAFTAFQIASAHTSVCKDDLALLKKDILDRVRDMIENRRPIQVRES